MKFVIDRFEDNYAILEDEDLNFIKVKRLLIDEVAGEGATVVYNGEKYIMDSVHESIENQNREWIKSKFDKLKKK